MLKILFTLALFFGCLFTLHGQTEHPDIAHLKQLQKTDLETARTTAERLMTSIPSKKGAHYHEIRINLAATLNKLKEIDTAWIVISEVPTERLPLERLKVEQLLQMADNQDLAGNTVQSNRYYFQAIELAKNAKLNKELGATYNLLGASYLNKGDFNRARSYFSKSLSLKKAMNDSLGMAITYNNLGSYFKKTQNIDSARFYYNKCVEIRKKTHDSVGLSFVYLNLAILEQVSGNRAEAIAIYQEVMELAKSNGDHETYVLGQTNVGLAHYFLGNYNRAETILLEALDFSNEHNEKTSLSSIYQGLSLICEKKGDATGVLNYRKLYHNHYVETFNLEKEKEVNRLQIKFDTKEKDLKINQLEQQKIENQLKSQEKELKNSKLFFWFTFLLSTLALVVVFVLIMYFRKKSFSKKQNLLLEEREILLKEVHHRVKNNLQIVSSLLSLQSEVSVDIDPKALLRQSQNRIQSIAIIHEKLYESTSLANIHLEEYVHQLIEHLSDSYDFEQLGILVNINIPFIQINLDQIVPCGLILNELITNSIKHAFDKGGTLSISAQLDEETILLDITDDGKGLPPDVNRLSSQSLGLKLANGLAKQLKGSLKHIETSVGTHFQLQLNQNL